MSTSDGSFAVRTAESFLFGSRPNWDDLSEQLVKLSDAHTSYTAKGSWFPLQLVVGDHWLLHLIQLVAQCTPLPVIVQQL